MTIPPSPSCDKSLPSPCLACKFKPTIDTTLHLIHHLRACYLAHLQWILSHFSSFSSLSPSPHPSPKTRLTLASPPATLSRVLNRSLQRTNVSTAVTSVILLGSKSIVARNTSSTWKSESRLNLDDSEEYNQLTNMVMAGVSKHNVYSFSETLWRIVRGMMDMGGGVMVIRMIMTRRMRMMVGWLGMWLGGRKSWGDEIGFLLAACVSETSDTMWAVCAGSRCHSLFS